MLDKLPVFPKIHLSSSLERMDAALRVQSEKLRPFRYDGPLGTKGRWKIEPFKVEAGISQLRYIRDGGRGMAPGTYHRLIRDGRTIVMSDTDAEMIDFLDVARPFYGRVLVSGLGMGLAIKALCMSPKVTSITIVELDQYLIDLVGAYVSRLCANANVTLNLIVGDTFKWMPPKHAKYDWAWHDIWDEISDENLPGMGKLRRRYAKHMAVKDRQLCWAEPQCRKLAANIDPRHW